MGNEELQKHTTTTWDDGEGAVLPLPPIIRPFISRSLGAEVSPRIVFVTLDVIQLSSKPCSFSLGSKAAHEAGT